MRYFLRSHAQLAKKNNIPPPVSPEASPIFADFDLQSLVESADQERTSISIAEDLGVPCYDQTELEPPPLVATSSDAPTPKQRDKSQSYKHFKRTLKRKNAATLVASTESTSPTKRTIEQAISPAKSINISFNSSELDVEKGAHRGKKGTKKALGTQEEREREYTLEELKKLGLKHYSWDGVTPMPVIDRNGLVGGVFSGRPNRSDFMKDMNGLFETMMEDGSVAGLGPSVTGHKRGNFPVFNRGVTMGMGTRHPVVLGNNEGVDELLTKLVGDERLKRLAGYQKATLKLWAPRLYDCYKTTVNGMFEKMGSNFSTRGRNFDNEIFTAAAFNFGGRVRTFKHRDHMNWPFGWCCITAMGRFDPRKSAHLILWEWKIVVDFPPGSTVFIPSAAVTHSNTSLAPGDQRTSFTQYTAGEIFRWFDNGFMTEKELKAKDSKKGEEVEKRKQGAVAERLKLYSHWGEILEHVL